MQLRHFRAGRNDNAETSGRDSDSAAEEEPMAHLQEPLPVASASKQLPFTLVSRAHKAKRRDNRSPPPTRPYVAHPPRHTMAPAVLSVLLDTPSLTVFHHQLMRMITKWTIRATCTSLLDPQSVLISCLVSHLALCGPLRSLLAQVEE